ncbi:type II toxin-antitoxin system RelE family toxin [Methylomonas rosea]|uniref:Type II toxin-antitoxin system RelE/ParE family toxin n=1 Tax=Methylomonas rosea TaxID=2952227 RepID=A0ABT1TW96_9GAMM|nr:type II toxin-antitoxin system RelE/ParE family toxin [Methylomonas sp. WSC-7]MCQ8119044.1 type II toxin-antitoxin system RelE/ParE family toxin [Methylomonas sp. WSC-7]
MAYKIAYKTSAEKSFSKLPKDVQKRIYVAVQHLADNPRPPGVKKLQSVVDRYRIRVGDSASFTPSMKVNSKYSWWQSATGVTFIRLDAVRIKFLNGLSFMSLPQMLAICYTC